ncbi:MAG: hypothetical protein A3D99_00990 [Candidatus Andersenbacteria bacterium RIFCSPHIGHO2_12_FULL_45_11]|uniref:Uncharacterized protein n=1 Tax=Candidatus Andersenbacteria bacterium RIFCSPHIGHO2_12_FULL_45_11 TaxID=1797281 RepID=A0A1G1X628_9BACT|nr:MAG: hypothetical protein A3D99_00990 [Candidatus Andersenbacteria bacterium RIFCSPHIGHO2_12_FULL_45_11]
MEEQKIQLYLWEGLNWDIDYDINGYGTPFALCSKQKCNCRLIKSKEPYSQGEYKYKCIKCDFKITLNKDIADKGTDFINILESLKYKDAEIINIDGDLIRVQREEKKDEDYWIDVKISKNKKDELQLMVLAGSKKGQDKVQLFLDPHNERLSFDQNNHHPKEIFAKVIAIFKNSKTEITTTRNSKGLLEL